MNCSRQEQQSASDRDRNARGNPPRRPNLVQRKAAQFDNLEPASQALRGLPEQIARRAAQHEKPCAEGPPIGQHSQHREQIRSALDFVDDDGGAEVGKGRHRLGQSGEVGRVLQVEIRRLAGANDGAREGRLARLARPGQKDDAPAAERAADSRLGARSADVYHEITIPNIIFSWRIKTCAGVSGGPP
jgi:hypothetical protein